MMEHMGCVSKVYISYEAVDRVLDIVNYYVWNKRHTEGLM